MKYTTGSITATGSGSAVSHTPDQTGPDSEGVVTISGTYTSPTLVVEKQMPGSDAWAPVALFNESTFTKNSASAAVTTDTTTSFRFSCGGAESVRAYLSAGSGLTATVHVATGTSKEFGGYATVLNSTATGSTTTFDSIVVRDSQTVALGTDSDLTMGWDGTDVDILAAADNTMITVGASGNSFDLKVFGADANGFFSWDASANDLKFEDSVSVMFGTGAGAGVGNAGDVELRWDATDLDLLAAANNTVFKIGNGTNSFDVWLFGSSASLYVSWDASANDLKFEDSVSLMFGTGGGAGPGNAGDVELRWDATDLDLLAAADDSVFKIGTGTNSFDVWLFGNAASTYVSWDASADSLKLEDNVFLGFGTNTAGPGTKGDINITWNGTKLLVAQTTVNSAIDWGVDGAGIDHVFYGDTASTSMTWDQSADSLILTGAAPLVFTGTTGQPRISLTDNLADALSIGIAASTDLLVLSTTNDAEAVAVRGMRTTSTTAVAITGATVLTLADSGGIFTVDQGSAYDVDLPSPTTGPGCSYFFSLTGPAANAVTITVAGAAATFVGSITIDGATIVATGSTLTFASGSASLGDSIEIRSIATNLYHVRAFASGAGGITVA